MQSYHAIALSMLFSLFVLCQSFRVCASENVVDFEKLERQLSEVQGLLIPQKDYAKIQELVDYIDTNLAENSDAYVTTAWKFFLVSERGMDVEIQILRERVYQNAINQNVDTLPFRLGQQIDIINNRKRYLLANYGELSLIKDRKNMAQKIIYNLQIIRSHIDEDWDEQKFDPKTLVEIPFDEPDLLMHPLSGPYGFLGLPSEKIKNPETREKFEQQVKKAKEMLEKASLQRTAKDVRARKEKVVRDFLVEMYSLPPFATSELESLLTEHKVDEAFAKEILDAVKEAEKNPPPPPEPRDPHAVAPPVVELGPFLPRPGESLEDFRKRFEAEWGPLEEGEELHLDGSISKTTETIIEFSRDDLRVAVKPYHPLPESSNRWKVVVLVNGIIIVLLAILWWVFRKGGN